MPVSVQIGRAGAGDSGGGGGVREYNRQDPRTEHALLFVEVDMLDSPQAIRLSTRTGMMDNSFHYKEFLVAFALPCSGQLSSDLGSYRAGDIELRKQRIHCSIGSIRDRAKESFFSYTGPEGPRIEG